MVAQAVAIRTRAVERALPLSRPREILRQAPGRSHRNKGLRATGPRAAPHLSRKDDETILLAPQSRRYCENTEFPRARLVAIVCNEAATPPLWRKAAFFGESFRE